MLGSSQVMENDVFIELNVTAGGKNKKKVVSKALSLESQEKRQ